MCSKGARVIDAARESRKVLDPLLDSFTASHRWLVNELRELGVLKDAESLSGPSNFAKGMEMSNKVARQKSPKESEK